MHTRVRAGDRLDVAAPRGTFVLQPGDDAGPADQRRGGGDPGPGHAARPGRRRVRPRGLVAPWCPQPARTSRSPRESRSLLAELARGHRHVCYSHPGPGDVPGRDYQTAGRLTAEVLADAGPAARRGCLPLRPGGLHGGRIGAPGSLGIDAGPACTPRSSVPRARRRRGSRPPRPGRRTRPRASRPGPQIAFARSSLTVPLGPAIRRACSSWPRPATSRCAGHAAPACATPARPACCPGRSATPRPGGGARRRQRADLLLPAARRPGPGPLTPAG